ncbi:MAG: Crp/Fnr family transcriptional regulator [Gammaproteobacteria bacterium]
MPLAENHLISLLPRAERQRVIGACSDATLDLGTVLYRPGQVTRHVYFPRSGYVSLVTADRGRPALEVGMVGREGMLGAHLALGVDREPLHAIVQGQGSARCLSGVAFRRELARGTGLKRAVDRYLYILMVQLATASSCTRFHGISARLARWLVMSQDRAGSATFPVTQAFLGYMLGVRRVSITDSAGDLQRRGLIRYQRGVITICDRDRLVAAACPCYKDDQAAYRDLLS